MILPSTYLATLALLVFSMLCLGLWANTFKLANNWRFELYYFDFTLGLMIVAIVAAFTIGSLGFDGFSFRDDILHASKKQAIYAALAGVIFNLANMLLLAAISVAGLSVAFPIGMGLALAIGALISYALHPVGNPVFYIAGAVVVLIAAAIDSQAYKTYKLANLDELVRTGKVKSTRKIVSMKGVFLSVIAGVLMSTYLPLVQKSSEGDAGLGAYSVAFMFALGIFLSTFLFNLFFMNLPVTGQPLEIQEYFKGNIRQHLLGMLGGAVWFAGTLAGLVAAAAEGKANAGPTLNFSLQQGATLIAALCGIFLWREFAQPKPQVRAFLAVMFAMFLIGMTMISVAPLAGR